MFENSLVILNRPKKRAVSRALVLQLAVLVHLLAGGAFLFASYWHVPEVPEPPINAVFFNAAAPPPPSDALSSRRNSKGRRPIDYARRRRPLIGSCTLLRATSPDMRTRSEPSMPTTPNGLRP